MKTYMKPSTLVLTLNTESLMDTASMQLDGTETINGSTGTFLGRRRNSDWDDEDEE